MCLSGKIGTNNYESGWKTTLRITIPKDTGKYLYKSDPADKGFVAPKKTLINGRPGHNQHGIRKL